MTEPIPVTTDVLAAALTCTPAHIRRLKQRGIITPIGKASRRGKGGRASDLWDLQQVIDTLRARDGDTSPSRPVRWNADGPRVPAPGSWP